jgi:DNA-binding CsgD family transcriptional regulator
MSQPQLGIVLFGDVVASRSIAGSTTWLRALRADLGKGTRTDRLAPFEFTQGDEVQGLLTPTADPIAVVFRACLHPDALPMRWVIAAGPIDAGTGPATQRTGPAFLAARELSGLARRRRDWLLVRTGDPGADALLDDVAPVLGRLLADLSPRQRTIARLLLVGGLRQVEAASRLDIRPPTVSVAAERARVREIAGLHDAIRRLLANGIAAAHGGGAA